MKCSWRKLKNRISILLVFLKLLGSLWASLPLGWSSVVRGTCYIYIKRTHLRRVKSPAILVLMQARNPDVHGVYSKARILEDVNGVMWSRKLRNECDFYTKSQQRHVYFLISWTSLQYHSTFSSYYLFILHQNRENEKPDSSLGKMPFGCQ